MGGETEDIGGVEEEVLAEVAGGAGFLAEVVVADAEEGSLGVVDDIANDVAELVGGVDPAERHEVVDVVDDDELGVVLLDEVLDVAVDGVEVLPLRAKYVEADEVEVFLGGGMGEELVVDLGADVWSVEGVDPEDLAARFGRGGGCGEEFCGE